MVSRRYILFGIFTGLFWPKKTIPFTMERTSTFKGVFIESNGVMIDGLQRTLAARKVDNG